MERPFPCSGAERLLPQVGGEPVDFGALGWGGGYVWLLRDGGRCGDEGGQHGEQDGDDALRANHIDLRMIPAPSAGREGLDDRPGDRSSTMMRIQPA
jgi:hypothetical protein